MSSSAIGFRCIVAKALQRRCGYARRGLASDGGNWSTYSDGGSSMQVLAEHGEFIVQIVTAIGADDPDAVDIRINGAGWDSILALNIPDVCFDEFVDCLIRARRRFRKLTAQSLAARAQAASPVLPEHERA
jgi:hypothetical protein